MPFKQAFFTDPNWSLLTNEVGAPTGIQSPQQGNFGLPTYDPSNETSLLLYPGLGQLTATASRAAIQRALDVGGSVTLRGSGVIYVDGTLTIGDNTTLTIADTLTIKLVDGLTNTPLFANKNQASGNTNITVQGGTWDGNGPNQIRTDGATFSAFCLLFVRCTNLKLRNFRLIEPRAWGLTLSLADNFTVENIHFDYSNTNLANQDGVHMVGCTNGTVRNIYGHTYDDMVAIVNEDYGVYANAVPPGASSNILIENVKSNALGAYRHVRLLDSTAYPATNITVRTVKGKYIVGGVFLGTISGKTALLKGILIDDLDIEPLSDSTTVPTVEINSAFYDVTITNVRRRIRSTETPQPIVGITSGGYTMRNIVIRGVECLDDSTTPPDYFKFSGAGCALYNLSIQDVNIVRSGAANGNLVVTGGTNVSALELDRISTQRVKRMVYVDAASGQIGKTNMSRMLLQNPSAPIFETAAAATIGTVAMSNTKISGTTHANGAFRFSGLTGTCLIDIAASDLQLGANPLVTRAGSEAIRVRTLCAAAVPTTLTPSRGDVILNASANNDPYRYDGAAWAAM